jgi:histidinol-phosphatase (PHP family)
MILTNYHTHTKYCDGANTPEEMILSALDKGFLSLGFSSHAYTSCGLDYSMIDAENYISEISTLKEKYKNEIEIYLGIEEDICEFAERNRYDYIIGSSHHVLKDGVYHCVDYNPDKTKEFINAYDGKALLAAEDYFKNFTAYILKRKPDIVGHFDLITKFDEMGEPFFSGNEEYEKLAEKYLKEAIKSECIFEINTGAISRGVRKTPYPAENLLYLLKKENANIIVSSDSHSKDTLDCAFKETRELLLDIGFKEQFALLGGKFQKIKL